MYPVDWSFCALLVIIMESTVVYNSASGVTDSFLMKTLEITISLSNNFHSLCKNHTLGYIIVSYYKLHSPVLEMC